MIPIVDLAADDETVREGLRRAFEEIGFVVVTGHGVGPDRLGSIVDAARAFFALAADDKFACAPQRWNPNASNRYRGYFPSEAHGKEGLDLGDPGLDDSHAELLAHPYYERNVYAERLGSEWVEAIDAYFEIMTPLATRIVFEALRAIDATPAWTEASFARPTAQTTLRFNCYPTETALASSDPDAPELFCEAHYDSTVLTLLHQDRQGGLQVRDTERRWIDVPFLEDAFVVNTGRALQIASGDRYPATIHRVVPTADARISIPFFLEPKWDAPIGDESYEIYLERVMQRLPEYVDR